MLSDIYCNVKCTACNINAYVISVTYYNVYSNIVFIYVLKYYWILMWNNKIYTSIVSFVYYYIEHTSCQVDFDALNQHFIKQYKNTGSYYCKRLFCQNLAYRQTEIKWSFFVEHLNLWFAGTHESHENWYTTNKNEFTVHSQNL